jgi:hypothetical protein
VRLNETGALSCVVANVLVASERGSRVGQGVGDSHIVRNLSRVGNGRLVSLWESPPSAFQKQPSSDKTDRTR